MSTQIDAGQHARAQSPKVNLKSVAAATLSGSFIEWYDFYIFGTASALVFGKLFFPSASPLAGTLLSFATFATAWIVRPLGGLIFGHFGDRVGRKKLLLITLTMMGLATVLVGCLPTYATIGTWAPVLLVVARLIQGISAGGEWSGAAATAIEYAPPNRRGFYGSFPQLGIPLALIVSNGLSLIFYRLPEHALLTYGWRIPFLLSAVVLAVGVFIRLRLVETPEFAEARQQDEVIRVPVLDAVRHHWRPILTVLFVMGGVNAFFFTFTTYSLSYATKTVGFSQTQALLALIVASAVHTVATLGWGALSDYIERRKLYVIGLVFLAIAPFPLFALIDQHSVALLFVAMIVFFGLGHSLVWSMGAAYFTEQFPTNVRYSASAIGYQFSGSIFGGPIPIIATALVAAANGAPWCVAILVSAIALAGAVAAAVSRRGPRQELYRPAARRTTAASINSPVSSAL